MSNGPWVTVEQGLEINKWIRVRERSLRGRIRNLENNLRQSSEAHTHWRTRCAELEMDNLWLRHRPTIRCRKRLIPVVKILLKI